MILKRTININKVIREIDNIIYDDTAQLPDKIRVIGVDFINCDKVIQIIKDNIKEIEPPDRRTIANKVFTEHDKLFPRKMNKKCTVYLGVK